MAPDLTPERLDDRRKLLAAYDELRRADEVRSALSDYRQQGFDLLTNPAAWKMFDLASEAPALRDRYGRTRFGQSCLLGRRLLEHGVPFVQVNWSDHVEAEEDAGDGGWDHHYRNFQVMQDRHAAWLDQTYSTLLDDLRDRGLLDSTLVIAVGEFGRTPKINDKAGRDHWEHCYSALLAGGGIKAGRVVGSSDKEAAHPVDTPVTPMDLIATVQHALGVTGNEAQNLGIANTGRVIAELFA
jgi:hypothetical protein